MGVENIPPEKRGNPAWVKGGPSPNPGGRPRALRDIEAMLDAEHRTLPKMREVYARLRSLAMGELIHVVDKDSGEVDIVLKSDPAYMKLYLDRLQGPVRELSERSEPAEMTDEELEAALRDGN